MYSCGHWIAIKESVVKADSVLRLEGSSPECYMGRAVRTPPGSESRACIHRDSSGTGESQLSPCK